MPSIRPRHLFAIALLAAATAAGAQTWPTKPVKVVVTFPPGGSSDVVARVIGPLIAAKLGQPFVVDNKPGAGATIGAAEVARAPADGYTLMLSNTAPISLSPFMLEPQPYDPNKSFTHVAYIGSVPNVFVVHPSVPANSVKEFIALAKSKPGELNYASSASGTSAHTAAELFKAMAFADPQLSALPGFDN